MLPLLFIIVPLFSFLPLGAGLLKQRTIGESDEESCKLSTKTNREYQESGTTEKWNLAFYPKGARRAR